jgi:hypothetical protein
MRNSGLVLAIAAILGTIATAQATSTGGPANFAAAQTQSTQEGRPVLLMFSTEW